jgi:hypothetical protein
MLLQLVEQARKTLNQRYFYNMKISWSAGVKEDPRMSTSNGSNAITNILIANIRNAQDVLIYKETAGVRAGRGTIYELGTVEPFTGPFGSIEYYKMLLRRAENQTVGD